MLLKYKEYVSYISFDEEVRYFYGEVLGLSGGISFEGKTVEELEAALKESVEFYLDLCKQRGVEPEKSYSGKLRLRLKKSLHKKLSLEAVTREASISKLINEMLTEALGPIEELEDDEKALFATEGVVASLSD